MHVSYRVIAQLIDAIVAGLWCIFSFFPLLVEIEKCPIIGSQACKDRILRLTCQYLARVKGIDKLPLPCQRILQDMNKPPSVLLEL